MRISPPTVDRVLRTAMAPVETTRSSADLTLANASGVWTAIDPTGSAAARNLDIVIPNVTAGQWIQIGLNALWGNQAPGTPLTMFTVVAGANVRNVAHATAGIIGWGGSVSVNSYVGPPYSFQVQAGDIENGAVRLRPHHLSAGTKTLFAGASFPLRFWGRGPF